MTPKKAAAALGISPKTVLYHLARPGSPLTGHRDEAGRWQVDPESVAAFVRRKAGQGRKPSPDSVRDATRRSLYLGSEISPEDVARIRRALPAALRGAVLLRLAEMDEEDRESFERALKDLGVSPG